MNAVTNLGVIECLQNKQGSMARLQNILLSPSLSNNQNSFSILPELMCLGGSDVEKVITINHTNTQTNTQNQN
jgi:hypothetical protein